MDVGRYRPRRTQQGTGRTPGRGMVATPPPTMNEQTRAPRRRGRHDRTETRMPVTTAAKLAGRGGREQKASSLPVISTPPSAIRHAHPCRTPFKDRNTADTDDSREPSCGGKGCCAAPRKAPESTRADDIATRLSQRNIFSHTRTTQRRYRRTIDPLVRRTMAKRVIHKIGGGGGGGGGRKAFRSTRSSSHHAASFHPFHAPRFPPKKPMRLTRERHPKLTTTALHRGDQR